MAVAARLRSAGARLIRLAALAGGGERRWPGTAAAEAVAESGALAGVARWEPMGAREYYDYRRAIYGDITHKAILVDVAGTLLAPTEPMAQVYRTIGEKYGVKYSEDEILMRYRRAYVQPWGRSRLRIIHHSGRSALPLESSATSALLPILNNQVAELRTNCSIHRYITSQPWNFWRG